MKPACDRHAQMSWWPNTGAERWDKRQAEADLMVRRVPQRGVVHAEILEPDQPAGRHQRRKVALDGRR